MIRISEFNINQFFMTEKKKDRKIKKKNPNYTFMSKNYQNLYRKPEDEMEITHLLAFAGCLWLLVGNPP
jgi:hypothetical protein